MPALFAGKLRSAVLWRIHALTGNQAAGAAAVTRYSAGRDAWAKMAERAKSVYRADITYGSNGSIRGHWLDRIPAFDAELADLRQRLAAPPAAANQVAPAVAKRALKIANAKPSRPGFTAQHTPNEALAGQPLDIALNCGAAKPRRVVLHYRHVNQAERWQSVELARNGAAFRGEIPAAYTNTRYVLQYYFEIETGPVEAILFPPLAADLANVPYYIVRLEKKSA